RPEHLPNPAEKWKRRYSGDVSSLQHGRWDGGDCRGAKRTKRNVDFTSEANWANRARIGENGSEIIGRPPRRTPVDYGNCGDAGSGAFTAPSRSGSAVGATAFPLRDTRCRPARKAARSTSSATRDFNARARVARKPREAR